jgi:hypothetical protein
LGGVLVVLVVVLLLNAGLTGSPHLATNACVSAGDSVVLKNHP